MKRILFSILITALATIELPAQTPPMPPMVGGQHHWTTNHVRRVVTNIEDVLVAQPCVFYHYYGLRQDGSVVEIGSVADHDPAMTAFEKGPFDRDFICVFRAESAAKLATIFHAEPNPWPQLPSSVYVFATNSTVRIPVQITTNFAPVLEPTPASGGGASSVLPDTVPPVVSFFDVEDGNITNFPVRVPLSSTYIKRAPGHGSWNDRESGQSTRQIFDVRFATQSNSFYTVWRASDMNLLWIEYPSPTNLHPARASFTNEMVLPILAGNRFYQVRAATLQ